MPGIETNSEKIAVQVHRMAATLGLACLPLLRKKVIPSWDLVITDPSSKRETFFLIKENAVTIWAKDPDHVIPDQRIRGYYRASPNLGMLLAFSASHVINLGLDD